VVSKAALRVVSQIAVSSILYNLPGIDWAEAGCIPSIPRIVLAQDPAQALLLHLALDLALDLALPADVW
jgi:hypothetical protein